MGSLALRLGLLLGLLALASGEHNIVLTAYSAVSLYHFMGLWYV